MLQDGGHFYVCGDAAHMAGAVESALLDIIGQHQARVVHEVVANLCPHVAPAQLIGQLPGKASLLAHAPTGLGRTETSEHVSSAASPFAMPICLASWQKRNFYTARAAQYPVAVDWRGGPNLAGVMHHMAVSAGRHRGGGTDVSGHDERHAALSAGCVVLTCDTVRSVSGIELCWTLLYTNFPANRAFSVPLCMGTLADPCPASETLMPEQMYLLLCGTMPCSCGEFALCACARVCIRINLCLCITLVVSSVR